MFWMSKAGGCCRRGKAPRAPGPRGPHLPGNSDGSVTCPVAIDSAYTLPLRTIRPAVVSTDCPSGSFELLVGGGSGPRVPVGDAAALAAAMQMTLEQPLSSETLRSAVGESGASASWVPALT